MNFIKSDPNNNSPQLSTNSSKGGDSTEEQDKGDIGILQIQVAGIPYNITEEDNTDLGEPPTCFSKAMIFVQRVSRFVSPFLQ